MASIVEGESAQIERYPYGQNPKVRAVGLDMVKEHIQVPHNADDDILDGDLGFGGYIDAATREVENRGGVSFILQRHRLTLGDINLVCKDVHLPFGPVTQLVAAKYLDVNGVEQTLPSTCYRFSAKSNSIYFNATLPARIEGPGTLWIEYEAGFGSSTSSVPSEWQDAILTLAMRKYERREGAAGSGDDAWERAFDRLIVACGGTRRY